ncbi:TRAF3-interacting protein 1 isoform X2 [Cimex lectularius]|uniref:TRAF3-interacting protein 1 n=1 Tax=Cimex lectularius TaxID=79782 RepID=A0A8I6RNY5_CIMLE|nr:TRAF3-interacting protein 1 isoform X2 [Cimex lectularius]
MSEDISPELIKKTQNSLAKYVKESLLNEKYLRKPPFKYLQDIIKNVIKETGFLKDVFAQDELVDYGKDKERKIAFLKKLIGAVHETTGDTISARPNKIIAGLDVPKTLELLQELGKAINLKENGVKKTSLPKRDESKEKKKRDTSATKEPVKKPKSKPDAVKSDENVKEKTKKKVKPDSKESDTKERKKREKPERDSSKDAKKAEEKKKEKKSSAEGHQEKKSKDPSLSKQSSLDENKENSSSRKGSGQKLKSPKEPKEEKLENIPEGNISNDDELVPSRKNSEVNEEEEPKENLQTESKDNVEKDKVESKDKLQTDGTTRKDDESAPKTAKERKTSSRKSSAKPKLEKVEKPEKASEKPKEVEVPLLGAPDSPVTVPKLERPKTARKAPPSARTGAPKPRDRGEVQNDLNVSSSDLEPKLVPVIIETDNKDDDKENLVVLETQPLSMDNDIQSGIIMPDMEDENLGENEGVLVAQILETKKELDESKQLWAPSTNKVEIEWEGGKKQKREAVIKEVNKMKEGIQQLTRATNPLGKLFDFLQEDVDSMQRELKLWMDTNANYSKQLKDEQRLSESSLETYKRQLAELDSLIEQEQEAVRNLKATILSNDKKIINIVTRVP